MTEPDLVDRVIAARMAKRDAPDIEALHEERKRQKQKALQALDMLEGWASQGWGHCGEDQIAFVGEKAAEVRTALENGVLEPIRDQLWEHGEITIAGLRRLDTSLGIDTYGEERTAERYTEASDDQ